jgi:hypothetical protein
MLVDYGSDSDSEAAPPAPVASASKSKLDLPPPKNANKKRAKIMLDVPVPAATDEPPSKRPKMTPGAGKSGLRAMLPPPKKSAGTAAAPKVAETPAKTQEEVAMIPLKVQQQQARTSTPSTDLFGIAASTSALPSLPKASSSRAGISSAPSVVEREKPNYYATLAPANPDDPYPGFHCLPSGQWAPNEPEEWEKWAALKGWSAQVEDPADLGEALPKGFEGSKFNDMSAASQEASKAQLNTGAIPVPSKIVPAPDNLEDEDARQDQLRQSRAKARGKNQLSSLLADSMLRREELEERIAVARQNRKSGGARYGACRPSFSLRV